MIKLPICNSITSLCQSNCVGGPPSLSWWSQQNLKIEETFLLFSHSTAKENLSYYQLLHHDVETGHKSWPRLPLHGVFTYKPLYWSGQKTFLFITQINSQPFIYLMPYVPPYPFTIGAHTKFEHSVNISAQKQTLYILLKVRCASLCLISTISLDYHYKGVLQ